MLTKRSLVVAVTAMTVSVFVLPAWADSTTTTTVSVLRINTGGGSAIDSQGRTWQADTYALGGHSHTVTSTIAGTPDQTLYKSERWGSTGYDIPVANGKYTMRLLFAEINPSSGKRVQTITLNGTTVLRDFDIAAKAGAFVAHDEKFPVTVSSSKIQLRMTASTNSTSIAGVEVLQTSTTSTPTTAPPAGWKLVTSDDFNGTSVDKSKWGLYSGAGNEGVGLRSPSAVTVSGGALNITGKGNTAGGMAMRTNQTYGRWVVRARMEKGDGYGPAILLWPQSEKWPVDGEIDLSEIPKGDRTKSYFTVHWGANNSQKGYSTTGDFTQWHTWTLEWTADHITLWIDDVLVGTITDKAAIPDGPMHLAIQNDVGAAGHWISGRTASTPATVALHVDSVKVYKKA